MERINSIIFIKRERERKRGERGEKEREKEQVSLKDERVGKGGRSFEVSGRERMK